MPVNTVNLNQPVVLQGGRIVLPKTPNPKENQSIMVEEEQLKNSLN